ncbi:MAG: 2-succinyl-5-enolpyruvyl-6-hydroxy-3-cyclohexene-1-carboxylic-acid synthase [Acidobacteriota bacterium]
MSIESNLQAEWARLLLGSLADAGVRDVVISPGSRSTPFVLAASKHTGLRCFDVIDERSAAYFALGQARVTGRPTLLLATSGTAGANYFPAVVEAGVAQVPLLVLTADRPVELAACGANQTIDQLGLYGRHVREFFDLGAPQGGSRVLRALRRMAAQAVFASCYPLPGAVHLNARVRKPLEPGAAESEAEHELTAAVDALLAAQGPQPHRPRRVPQAADIDELAKLCRRTERGLIVCGPAPLAQARSRSLIAELGRRTGYPILRESASQLRFGNELAEDVLTVDAFDALLKSPQFRQRAAPRLILQIGRSATSRAWAGLLNEQAGIGHWVLGGGDWYDAESTASHRLATDLDPCLALLTTKLPARRMPGAWSEFWGEGERLAQTAVEEELKASSDELSEGGVARALVEALPAGTLLALGNSLPIRQVDLYGRARKVDLRVWSQRGASGIDGVVSGVLGAASVWRHRVALLVGDVSFLHDLSGLHAARHVAVPVVIVVVQNRGGRIFEQLPLASSSAAKGVTLEHWTTPHDLDFAHAAALYDLPFHRATTLAELEQALSESFRREGVSVVEARVPDHGAVEQNRRVWRRVDELVGQGADD